MAEICEHCKKPWATVDDDESHMHQLAGGARPAEWVDFRGSHLCWRVRVLDQGPARPARYAGSCALEIGEGLLILEVARLLGLQSHAIGSWDYGEIIKEVEAVLHQVAALHEGQKTLGRHIERQAEELRKSAGEIAYFKKIIVGLDAREAVVCKTCQGDLVVCRECERRRSDMRHIDMVVGHGPCRGAGVKQCPACGGSGGAWRNRDPNEKVPPV
jgi:hypothetical protein